MKRSLLVCAVFAFVIGCGAQFGGTYSGTTTLNMLCGSNTINSGSEGTMTLTQNGGTVSISNDACPGMTGTINGDTVNLVSTICPAKTLSDGSQMTITYTSGTLKLTGNSLAVDIASNAAIMTSEGSGTCTGSVKGTMTKTK